MTYPHLGEENDSVGAKVFAVGFSIAVVAVLLPILLEHSNEYPSVTKQVQRPVCHT